MDQEVAQAVLSKNYNLADAQPIFLGQSQNITFRVETSTGERFLLRFHTGPATVDQCAQDFWSEPSAIQSELLWLNAIAQDTELIVPQPVQNDSGKWVTHWENLPVCSLLRWVEGNHIEDEPTAQQVYHLGVLMARLHQHSIRWTLPPEFSRPSHDATPLESAIAPLEKLVKIGTITREDYQIFQEATANVQTLISSLERTQDSWGLIHADLHRGNYVFYNEEIHPIDFSRCGFGFYLYDIGEAVRDFDAALRSHFFEGYTSIQALPANYQPLVEAFFIGATVENFAFLSANPQEHEWLAQAVPYVVQNHLHSYLQGETFLFVN